MHECYQTTVEKNHGTEAVFRIGERMTVAFFLLLGFLSARFFFSFVPNTAAVLKSTKLEDTALFNK